MPQQFETVEEIVKKAMTASLNDFVQLIEQATDLLSTEGKHFGHFVVNGRLIEGSPTGEVSVVGDLHGDLDSAASILKDSRFLFKAQRDEPTLLVFLGDYGDRGPFSSEVYYVVLSLKLNFPDKVILMRGNHEGPDDLLATPHDLPAQLSSRFGEGWPTAYAKLKNLFNYLSNAFVVKNRCVMLHGGVPSQASSSYDLAYAHLTHPQKSHLEELLWSDPEEGINGTYPSPRGAGNLFGENVTIKFLEMLGVKVLIRGHESCDQGYRINHSGRVLTLFSRKGAPYFNSHGAFLLFDPAREEFNDAFEFQRFIRQL